MRPLTLAAPAVLLLALTACAPTVGRGGYADELRQLSESCAARDGILVSTGQLSDRPQNDHVCRISGPGSRLTDGR